LPFVLVCFSPSELNLDANKLFDLKECPYDKDVALKLVEYIKDPKSKEAKFFKEIKGTSPFSFFIQIIYKSFILAFFFPLAHISLLIFLR